MNVLEGISIAKKLLDDWLPLFEQLIAFWLRVRLRPAKLPLRDYENLLLEAVVEIKDRGGRKAILNKRQRIRINNPDTTTVRDLVWGEGRPIARFSAQGAKRLGLQGEGVRKALLLGIDHRPMRGERLQIRSRRLMKDAFREHFEYWEMIAERPTKRLTMKVIFPRKRAPKEARIVSSPPEQTLRKVMVRYTPDQRPFLSWSHRDPAINTSYGLRWSW